MADDVTRIAKMENAESEGGEQYGKKYIRPGFPYLLVVQKQDHEHAQYYCPVHDNDKKTIDQLLERLVHCTPNLRSGNRPTT